MKSAVFVPNSPRVAAEKLRIAFGQKLSELNRTDFVAAWCSIAYLFPGLHPDGFEDVDSGWPRVLKRFATEAWRRDEAGEMADEELYASDVAWAGLFDQMHTTLPDERARRNELAASFGLPLCD